MSRPWMPLYVADYLKDTGHLTTAEHGAYLLLIMHYWANGSLPPDDRKLARIARMTDREWKTSRDTLAEFFDASWRHERIEKELAEAAEKSESARTSAAKRWEKKRNADVMRTHKQPQCSSQSQSQSQPTAASDEAAAATAPPPLAENDLREKCIAAAGQDFPRGFGLIRDLAGDDDPETRILPLIREASADMRRRGEKIGSWAFFAELIRDPDRQPTPSPIVIDAVWCPIDSPEFAAGNRARAMRGETPYRGVSSRNHEGRGASFPRADIEPQGSRA